MTFFIFRFWVCSPYVSAPFHHHLPFPAMDQATTTRAQFTWWLMSRLAHRWWAAWGGCSLKMLPVWSPATFLSKVWGKENGGLNCIESWSLYPATFVWLSEPSGLAIRLPLPLFCSWHLEIGKVNWYWRKGKRLWKNWHEMKLGNRCPAVATYWSWLVWICTKTS